MVMQGEGLLHTEPVAAPSCLCCAPDSPPAIPSHTGDSTAIPGPQGVRYTLHSAIPALCQRVKAPLAVIAKAPVLDSLLQHPVPSRGSISSQKSRLNSASLALTLHCPLIPEVPPGYH